MVLSIVNDDLSLSKTIDSLFSLTIVIGIENRGLISVQF